MAKIEILFDDQGWPIPGRVPFLGKGDYITALHTAIEEKRGAVEAEQRKLRGQVLYLNDTLVDPFEVDFQPVREYSARFLDTERVFDEGDNKPDYSIRKERLAHVWSSIIGVNELNKARAGECAFRLAESYRVLADLETRPDLERLMETRVLYELARDLAEDNGVTLAAEARLLELKYVTLKDATIDASFARLAHEDPALVVGRYGSLESLSGVTRAAFCLSPQDDQAPSAQFVRSTYEILRNNNVTDKHRGKFTSVVGEDPTLIEPLMAIPGALPDTYGDVKTKLTEIGESLSAREEAESKLREAAESPSGSAQEWFTLAECLLTREPVGPKKEQYARYALFRSLETRDSSLIDKALALSEEYATQGKYGKVLALLIQEEVLKSEPDHPLALGMYGLTVASTPNSEEDAKGYLYRAAAANDQRTTTYLLERGTELMDRNVRMAEIVFDEVRKAQPNNRRAWEGLETAVRGSVSPSEERIEWANYCAFQVRELSVSLPL